jgi:hypothetical protein
MFEIFLGIVLYLVLGGVTAGVFRHLTRGALHPLGAVFWPLVVVGALGALVLDMGTWVTSKLLGRK